MTPLPQIFFLSLCISSQFISCTLLFFPMFIPTSQLPGTLSPRSSWGWLFLTLQVSTVVSPLQRGLPHHTQHIILDSVILFVYLPPLYCMLRRVVTVLFTTDSPVANPYFSKNVLGQQRHRFRLA